MKKKYITKKKVIIILICIILVLFPFRYIIITDIQFLFGYKHFEEVIEIIRNDYLNENYNASRIEILNGEIVIDKVRSALELENKELADELKSIYGIASEAYIEIYFDENNNIAVEFILNIHKQKSLENYAAYSVVYVEEGFVCSNEWLLSHNMWMEVHNLKKSKSDYPSKVNWYRWSENRSVG